LSRLFEKIWISHTFCPFWSQFWSTKCKQIGLGTKISIKIFVKIHYFSIEIEKYSRNPQKAQIITKVSICLEKSRSRLKSTVLANLIETKSRYLDLDRDFSIVETNFWKPSRLSITSRLILFWRRDRDLDRDHVETNRDPQP
jgi:hypothetical protein